MSPLIPALPPIERRQPPPDLSTFLFGPRVKGKLGIAMALRSSEAARVAPDAVGAAREGLVYQHLVAWCDAMRDAHLSTWRTVGGVEVDFVVETSDDLIAIEVKTGSTLRPADRRGLLAFHDEFPTARLLALTDAATRAQTPESARRPP